MQYIRYQRIKIQITQPQRFLYERILADKPEKTISYKAPNM